MKSFILGCFVVAAALAHGNNIPASQLTPEQREARTQARRAAKVAAKGGYVEKQVTGKYFRIVSEQDTVGLDRLKDLAKDLATGFKVPMEVSTAVRGKCIFEDAMKAKAIPKTGAVLLVIEDDNLPTLLAASEDGWSVLNVAKLRKDLPPESVYEDRVRKEFNRAAAQAFGAGTSFNRPCVMVPVITMNDLDAIGIKIVSPEALAKMDESCRLMGIEPRRRATYLKACQEGWAPPPTNDVQRRIWNEVHTVPSTPLKLEK